MASSKRQLLHCTSRALAHPISRGTQKRPLADALLTLKNFVSSFLAGIDPLFSSFSFTDVRADSLISWVLLRSSRPCKAIITVFKVGKDP